MSPPGAPLFPIFGSCQLLPMGFHLVHAGKKLGGGSAGPASPGALSIPLLVWPSFIFPRLLQTPSCLASHQTSCLLISPLPSTSWQVFLPTCYRTRSPLPEEEPPLTGLCSEKSEMHPMQDIQSSHLCPWGWLKWDVIVHSFSRASLRGSICSLRSKQCKYNSLLQNWCLYETWLLCQLW